MRRMTILMLLLSAAVLVCGVPAHGHAAETAKKSEKAGDQGRSDDPDGKKGIDLRGGINRVYEGFKKESAKGKKNLKDLYEREKAKSTD